MSEANEECEETDEEGWEAADPEEEEEDITVRCLYCTMTISNCDIEQHMKAVHHIDGFSSWLAKNGYIDPYQRIRLVNFLRERVEHQKCPHCDCVFDSLQSILQHMKETEHFLPLKPPEGDNWLILRQPHDSFLEYVVEMENDEPDEDYPMIEPLIDLLKKKQAEIQAAKTQ